MQISLHVYEASLSFQKKHQGNEFQRRRSINLKSNPKNGQENAPETGNSGSMHEDAVL
jgi:hypothetical protein